METTKTIPKNSKNTKNKNRLLFFWGWGNLSLFFSCYALAALQPSTITAINQDIHHKTAT